MVLMVRRHASLMFYCGGNELWPFHKNPARGLQQGLREIIASLDDRFLIMSSMDGGYKGGNMSEHDDAYALAAEDGPYDFLTLVTYFAQKNPGMKNGTTVSQAFQPEIGSSGMPRFQTMQRMGLVKNGTDFPRGLSKYIPRLWRYHKYQGYGIRDVASNNIINDGILAYGESTNSREFIVRAQLVCLQQYQTLFEGFTSKMFAPASSGGKSAVIMWKTQSPWPSLRGFLYDWWLGTTGSLVGVRKGTGGNRPGKVQLNLASMRVELVNRGRKRFVKNSTARVEWYTLDGGLVRAQTNIFLGPVNPMNVARSNPNNPVLIPTVRPGRVLFAKVISEPWENA